LEKSNHSIYNPNDSNNKSFNFVIVGRIVNQQSRYHAHDYLLQLLNQNPGLIDVNILDTFDDY